MVSVALLAVACAEEVSILRNEQSVNPDGSYQYAYETSDGVAVEEQGHLKNAGTENESIVSNTTGTFDRQTRSIKCDKFYNQY